METVVEANSQPPMLDSTNTDQTTENLAPDNSNHEDSEPKVDLSPEEMRKIIEVMAATGKFWHDWIFLRSLLSYQLKQVLAEYPEAQSVGGTGLQQSSLPGETYTELVTRLDEALLSFEEGPPFTLQRLCEILLSPKSTYKNLSKLALALEKNLLVTSTLTKSTDPYPSSLEQIPENTDINNNDNYYNNNNIKASEVTLPVNSNQDPVPNGVETESATQSVAAGPATQSVAADAEAQSVAADTAAQSVVAGSAAQSVAPDSAAQSVAADPASQSMVTDSGAQSVEVKSVAQSVVVESTTQSVTSESVPQSVADNSAAQYVADNCAAHSVAAVDRDEEMPDVETELENPNNNYSNNNPPDVEMKDEQDTTTETRTETEIETVDPTCQMDTVSGTSDNSTASAEPGTVNEDSSVSPAVP